MGLLESIGFGNKTSLGTSTELPVIFPLAVAQSDFVTNDLQNIYERILTDVLERTQGLPEKFQPHLFDNCLAGEQDFGVVTMLAKAMSIKGDLVVIYDSGTDVLRKPTAEEDRQIKASIKDGKTELPKGALSVSFKDYKRTDMLKIYSVFEYLAISGLNKNMNLANAVQIKVDQLRASVGKSDADAVIAQAKAIADALNKGLGVMIDAKDILDMLKPDLTATNSVVDFINQKRSFYLGLPSSWITGLAKNSMGDTGEGNAKEVERGLKAYFFSIVKPVLKALFDANVTFKSDDFRQMSTALDVLRTMESTSEEFMSAESKLKTVNKAFGFPEDTKGGPAPTPVAPAAAVVPANGGQNANA